MDVNRPANHSNAYNLRSNRSSSVSNFKGAGSVIDKSMLQQQERRTRALARDLYRSSADEVNKLVPSVSCSVKSSWQSSPSQSMLVPQIFIDIILELISCQNSLEGSPYAI